MHHPKLCWPDLILLCLLLSSVLAIWPAPQDIHQGEELVRISSNFSIDFLKQPSSPKTISVDLATAIAITLRQLREDRHQILTPDRGASLYQKLSTDSKSTKAPLHQLLINYSPTKSKSNPHARAAATLEFSKHSILASPMENSQVDNDNSSLNGPSIVAEMALPIKSRDESYELTIGPDTITGNPQAILSASSALGILRGLQTFSQLVYTVKSPTILTTSNSDGLTDQESETHSIHSSSIPSLRTDFRFLHAPVMIRDSPAFPYRGLLLDTSRNFYSIETLKKILETMSSVKLNVFHWHIVDSQSWPLEIPTHPELTRSGAYSPSQVYKLEDVKELTRFANSKGIEIMLEIDTPGHTAIIGEAFPNLVACKDATPWSTYAAEPPAGQLRLANDDALKLIVDIFSHVTEQIPGTLFSSGGDEVNKKCYEDDEVTQASLRAKNQTINQALSNFVLKTHEAIRKSHKVPVVWEELVLDEKIDLPHDAAIAVWRSSANARAVVDKGYPIIHAASDYSYLDCGLGDWLGNSINGTSWCDPFKTWQRIYSFDPYRNVTVSQRKQVFGGQALLWSEQADDQNVESVIWPRALSTAEVYWTGEDRPRSVTEALPRIHDMRYRLVQRGVRATPLQPHWCAVRPGQCDLPPGLRDD